jgi:phosphoglycerate dehydrogenase-like enzyme
MKAIPPAPSISFIRASRPLTSLLNSPFFIDNPNVIIQPHMGGLTDVSWRKAYTEAMENVRSFLETGQAISPVNA